MANSPEERHLAIKVIMMPRDTNPFGTIFGGVILSYIDQAGAVGARSVMHTRDFPKRQIVTVAMNRVEFHHPVYVGDTVSFWTSLRNIGRTSLTINVAVETERDGQSLLLTQAEVSYVAVENRGGNLTPVPVDAPA